MKRMITCLIMALLALSVVTAQELEDQEEIKFTGGILIGPFEAVSVPDSLPSMAFKLGFPVGARFYDAGGIVAIPFMTYIIVDSSVAGVASVGGGLSLGAFLSDAGVHFGIDIPVVEYQYAAYGGWEVETLITPADIFRINFTIGAEGRLSSLDPNSSSVRGAFVVGYSAYESTSIVTVGIQVGLIK